MFISIIDSLPLCTDFYWVHLESGEIELAYFNSYTGSFLSADSAGDTEGLHIEFYKNVTHWADLQEPEFTIRISEEE